MFVRFRGFGRNVRDKELMSVKSLMLLGESMALELFGELDQENLRIAFTSEITFSLALRHNSDQVQDYTERLGLANFA